MADNKLIRTIYAGIKALGLSETEYRALYKGATGKESLKDMTNRQLGLVIDALKKAGFTMDHPLQKQVATNPLIPKIHSLWLELRDTGTLRDSSYKSLEKFAKNQTGFELYDPKNPHLVVFTEQLKNWVTRVKEEQCRKNSVAQSF